MEVVGEVPDAGFVLEQASASEHHGVGGSQVAAQGHGVEVAERIDVVCGGRFGGVQRGSGDRYAPVCQEAAQD